MPWKRTPIEERFWSRVRKTETCWLWTGGLTRGYGRISPGGRNGPGKKPIRVHRYAFELFWGPIPTGLQLRHLCGNSMCVRPSHLAVGTAKDNADDRERHGRTNRPRKGKWSVKHRRCVSCGKTDSIHSSRGRCNRCYQREWRRTH